MTGLAITLSILIAGIYLKIYPLIYISGGTLAIAVLLACIYFINTEKHEKIKPLLINKIRSAYKDAKLAVSHDYLIIFPYKNARFLAIDDAQLKIMVGQNCSPESLVENIKFNSMIISADKILGVQVLEDGKNVTNTGDTLGMAAIGGVMFGGAGAIVGAIASKQDKSKVSNISLVIAIDDLTTPFVNFSFLEMEVDKNSEQYKTAYSQANKWMAMINVLVSRGRNVK